MEQVVQRLRPYLLGWKAYFGLAQTPKVWRELDEWLRHRLRAIQLKHWKRPTTMYRELQALGAGPTVAKRVAANSRRWWRNSDGLLKTVLCPDSHDLKLSNRPVRTRMPGGVAGAPPIMGAPTIAYFDRLGARERRPRRTCPLRHRSIRCAAPGDTQARTIGLFLHSS